MHCRKLADNAIRRGCGKKDKCHSSRSGHHIEGKVLKRSLASSGRHNKGSNTWRCCAPYHCCHNSIHSKLPKVLWPWLWAQACLTDPKAKTQKQHHLLILPALRTGNHCAACAQETCLTNPTVLASPAADTMEQTTLLCCTLRPRWLQNPLLLYTANTSIKSCAGQLSAGQVVQLLRCLLLGFGTTPSWPSRRSGCLLL